jgi:hypothetical protein
MYGRRNTGVEQKKRLQRTLGRSVRYIRSRFTSGIYPLAAVCLSPINSCLRSRLSEMSHFNIRTTGRLLTWEFDRAQRGFYPFERRSVSLITQLSGALKMNRDRTINTK